MCTSRSRGQLVLTQLWNCPSKKTVHSFATEISKQNKQVQICCVNLWWQEWKRNVQPEAAVYMLLRPKSKRSCWQTHSYFSNCAVHKLKGAHSRLFLPNWLGFLRPHTSLHDGASAIVPVSCHQIQKVFSYPAKLMERQLPSWTLGGRLEPPRTQIWTECLFAKGYFSVLEGIKKQSWIENKLHPLKMNFSSQRKYRGLDRKHSRKYESFSSSSPQSILNINSSSSSFWFVLSGTVCAHVHVCVMKMQLLSLEKPVEHWLVLESCSSVTF